MRRVMCVWFPLWPVQRLRSEPHTARERRSESGVSRGASGSASHEGDTAALSKPVILFETGRRGFQVITYSPEVAQWGIRVGMPIGEVRSLLPGFAPGSPPSKRRGMARPAEPLLKQADPTADRLRLQQIALSCHAYSPLVGLEDSPRPESIWLDISGSETLFGGERGIIQALRLQMIQQGFQVRIAIADTWGAAWAVSHFGNAEIALVPSDQQAKWIASLPPTALRIPESVWESLRTLDIKTIGLLMRAPRRSLPSRFGREIVHRLDQALGLAPELLIAERLVEPLFAEWLFEEPIADRQTIDRVCDVLLERLLTQLDERRAGLRELACHWLGTVAEPTSLRLLRPTTDRRHLFGLLHLQCERRVFTSGIHGIRMEVVEIGLTAVRQTTLFGDDTHGNDPQVLAELVDRLNTRLGHQAVLRPYLTSDAQPEFACHYSPWLDAPPANRAESIAHPSRLRCRPLRLFRSPQPLLVQEISTTGLPCRINRSAVTWLSGPERIETGWWRGPDVKRDYYRIDLANGTALWAFVDLATGQWFLHGLFV